MDYLPVFLNMQQQPAVVVGGGTVASRKAALIARSGAHLRIVSPTLSPAMRELLADNAEFDWLAAEFSAEHIDDAVLVIAATDHQDVNQAVADAARERRIPVNVVDTPELCSFILPAIVDRSPVVVAVSTGGRSPVLARYTKALLERALPAALGRLATFLGSLRPRVAARLVEPRRRRRFWEQLLEGELPELLYAGQDAAALALVEAQLAPQDVDRDKSGAVYLIGAGPGNPELLTLRAQRLLQRADVVLYDRLVPLGVLEMCRREAEMIYVGKRHGDHPLSQEEISALLVEYASAGKRVARLKGGDPFVFGRGGEEIECLAEAGIDFQVVPGISAANGCAAFAGIPLTHRDHAQGVSYFTGHTRNGELDLDWSSMCVERQTLVFYMGVAAAPIISRKLIEQGVAATTPAAVIQAGTTTQQKVFRCSLHGLRDAASEVEAGLPALIIIGSVVNLRRDLGWFQANGADGEAVFPAHRRSAEEQSGIAAA